MTKLIAVLLFTGLCFTAMCLHFEEANLIPPAVFFTVIGGFLTFQAHLAWAREVDRARKQNIFLRDIL